MKVEFKKTYAKGDVVVVYYEKAGLDKAGKAFDAELKGAITKAVKSSTFEGKTGEAVSLTPQGIPAARVLCIGMGEKDRADALALEKLGAYAVKYVASAKTEELNVVMDAPPGVSSANVGFGGLLRAYTFDKYKSKKTPASLKKLTVVSPDFASAAKEFKRLEAIARGIYTARDLVSEPPNVLNPVEFAKRAQELSKSGIKVEIWDDREITQKKMGLIMAVARASANKPRLAVMRYEGAKSKTAAPVVLVGKGICYDTGGLCLKPGASMASMKQDMAGAAAVIGTMQSLALQKAPVNVIGITPMVENAIGGNAYRPDDVVTSYSGQTVEIINTDAEGRLILADALTLAQEYKPAAVIDLATLTGLMSAMMGSEYAGIFSNDDKLSQSLRKAGAKTDEKLWPFPMDDFYDGMLKSEIADFKHMGKGSAGSIAAACFLKRFIQDGTRWAHLDIAGTAYVDAKDKVINPVNATGFGVYLLNAFINDNYVR